MYLDFYGFTEKPFTITYMRRSAFIRRDFALLAEAKSASQSFPTKSESILSLKLVIAYILSYLLQAVSRKKRTVHMTRAYHL